MIKKSTWLHLRIPFSFFLLPVFLFAFSISADPDILKTILVFICLHVFLYPASNGYNSYFDKDEDSIGGLKEPPPVSNQLYYTALFFDLVALILGLMISLEFFAMILIYGLVSKAYSHPRIRLKKLPVIGWIVIGIFQGFVTFLAVVQGINDLTIAELLAPGLIIPATLSTMLLWGSYPMTQVYQHKEDKKRGDITISVKLGILGTFYFTAAMFTLANVGFLVYYYLYFGVFQAILFQLFLLPILTYFLWWFNKVRLDNSLADFTHTMRLNLISSTTLSIFFLTFRIFFYT